MGRFDFTEAAALPFLRDHEDEEEDDAQEIARAAGRSVVKRWELAR